MEVNEIYNTDCFVGMKQIPDESIDLVVTDPPYGINFNSNYRVESELKTTKGILNDGTDNLPFLESIAKQMYRTMKDNTHLYWFTRWDKVHEQKPMLNDVGFNVKNNIIWVKNNWSMGDLKGSYAGQYECILFCQKGNRELNKVNGRSRHSDILNYDRVGSSALIHSHQKPIALIDFLIRKSSFEGDLVLDAFMGSGTTAVAAYESGRDFIGFELDDEHYRKSKERLRESMARTSIFDFI